MLPATWPYHVLRDIGDRRLGGRVWVEGREDCVGVSGCEGALSGMLAKVLPFYLRLTGMLTTSGILLYLAIVVWERGVTPLATTATK